MSTFLAKLIRREDLSDQEAKELMQSVMTGKAGELQTAACLIALASKGETGEEIAAFAQVMRGSALAWLPEEELAGGAQKLSVEKLYTDSFSKSKERESKSSILCDTCGTGGDGAATINISTLSAIILAALGIPIAKHGNRAVSSKSGSADLLEGLGITLEASPKAITECLQGVGITFLYAPYWHPAMKYAAPVRKALGVRTVFNLLGPITNPAPITHQLVGVFHKSFQFPLSEALARLGREAYVVCSTDGLDEISCAAPTHFIRVASGKIAETGKLAPEDFGFSRHSLQELGITSLEEALKRSRCLLAGKGRPAENYAVTMNAALIYSLVKQVSLKQAALVCLDAIQAGQGLEVIERWRSYTSNKN